MDDEQAIRGIIAAWMTASKSGDKEKVLSLMADDVVFLAAGQPPMRGKAAFAAAQPALDAFEVDGTSDIQELKVFGDWAYVWAVLSVAVKPKHGGAVIKRAGHTLSVLHKENGAWLLYRDANMLAAIQ